MVDTRYGLDWHRVRVSRPEAVVQGEVHYAPVKSLWFVGMALAAVIGGTVTFSWTALAIFFTCTAFVLLFGHSLGSHRKLIHNSFQCPKWLEYALVYSGVQVGLAGPLGLMRQHELRDYAQRLPNCHDYLRHGRGPWQDAWWQLNCELRLSEPPEIRIESRVADDRFYRFLERTWMLQQLPPALLLFALGGWSFVFWGVCARVTAGVFGHWLIGYFAHNRGGMRHVVEGAAVQGRNIPMTSLLTMGECWHNNHHAFPGSARLGLYAGEWDPGWVGAPPPAQDRVGERLAPAPRPAGQTRAQEPRQRSLTLRPEGFAQVRAGPSHLSETNFATTVSKAQA
jgi:fatty-acid desaturase